MPLETLRLRVASLEDAKRLFDWSGALGPDVAPVGFRGRRLEFHFIDSNLW